VAAEAGGEGEEGPPVQLGVDVGADETGGAGVGDDGDGQGLDLLVTFGEHGGDPLEEEKLGTTYEWGQYGYAS